MVVIKRVVFRRQYGLDQLFRYLVYSHRYTFFFPEFGDERAFGAVDAHGHLEVIVIQGVQGRQGRRQYQGHESGEYDAGDK